MNRRVVVLYGLIWSLGSGEPVRVLSAGVSRRWRAMVAYRIAVVSSTLVSVMIRVFQPRRR